MTREEQATAVEAVCDLAASAMGEPLVAVGVLSGEALEVLEVAGRSDRQVERLPLPSGLVEERWNDISGVRLSAAWTLALGQRPSHLAFGTVVGTPWHWVTACRCDGSEPPGLAPLQSACRALAAVHAAG